MSARPAEPHFLATAPVRLPVLLRVPSVPLRITTTNPSLLFCVVPVQAAPRRGRSFSSPTGYDDSARPWYYVHVMGTDVSGTSGRAMVASRLSDVVDVLLQLYFLGNRVSVLSAGRLNPAKTVVSAAGIPELEGIAVAHAHTSLATVAQARIRFSMSNTLCPRSERPASRPCAGHAGHTRRWG
jgi:hypothetical protein